MHTFLELRGGQLTMWGREWWRGNFPEGNEGGPGEAQMVDVQHSTPLQISSGDLGTGGWRWGNEKSWQWQWVESVCWLEDLSFVKNQPSSSDTVQPVRDRKGPSPYSRLCALTKAQCWIAWAILKFQHSYWIFCTSIVIKVLQVHPFSAVMVHVQDFAFSFVPFQIRGHVLGWRKNILSHFASLHFLFLWK